MNFHILTKSYDSMSFLVKGIDYSLANTIRRIILTEVPSMAVDDVMVIENSSVLSDEFLALRIGLLPLKTNLDAYNIPEECSCNSELGCNLCRTVLTLDVEAKNGNRIVYSGDLISDDPGIYPVADKVPIAKLVSNQKIRLEAYARLGKGITHAKWQPISACTYRYMPAVEIDSALCDACGDCVDICPRKVFEKNSEKVRVVNEIECTLCEDCVKICAKEPKAVTVKGDETSFIFFIESTGSLPIERILTEALKIYDQKCVEFINKMEIKEDVSQKTA